MVHEQESHKETHFRLHLFALQQDSETQAIQGGCSKYSQNIVRSRILPVVPTQVSIRQDDSWGDRDRAEAPERKKGAFQNGLLRD